MMTAAARSILVRSIRRFENLALLQEEEQIRSEYTALIVDLRSIGHVLKNTDACKDVHLKRAIESHYSWSAGCPELHFMKFERDRILKEGVKGVSIALVSRVRPGMNKLALGHATDIGISDRQIYHYIPKLTVLDGYYDGQDALEWIRKCIGFWDRSLEWIDQQYRNLVATRDAAISQLRTRERRNRSANEPNVSAQIAARLALQSARTWGFSVGQQEAHALDILRSTHPLTSPKHLSMTLRRIGAPQKLCDE